MGMTALAIAALAATGYGIYSSDKAQKDAKKEQEAAIKKSEQTALAKTPEMQTPDTDAQKIKKINAYRAGAMGNIKTAGLGLPNQAQTVNQSAAGGLKTRIGD